MRAWWLSPRPDRACYIRSEDSIWSGSVRTLCSATSRGHSSHLFRPESAVASVHSGMFPEATQSCGGWTNAGPPVLPVPCRPAKCPTRHSLTHNFRQINSLPAGRSARRRCRNVCFFRVDGTRIGWTSGHTTEGKRMTGFLDAVDSMATSVWIGQDGGVGIHSWLDQLG
jgi:hypothetical protein